MPTADDVNSWISGNTTQGMSAPDSEGLSSMLSYAPSYDAIANNFFPGASNAQQMLAGLAGDYSTATRWGAPDNILYPYATDYFKQDPSSIYNPANSDNFSSTPTSWYPLEYTAKKLYDQYGVTPGQALPSSVFGAPGNLNPAQYNAFGLTHDDYLRSIGALDNNGGTGFGARALDMWNSPAGTIGKLAFGVGGAMDAATSLAEVGNAGMSTMGAGSFVNPVTLTAEATGPMSTTAALQSAAGAGAFAAPAVSGTAGLSDLWKAPKSPGVQTFNDLKTGINSLQTLTNSNAPGASKAAAGVNLGRNAMSSGGDLWQSAVDYFGGGSGGGGMDFSAIPSSFSGGDSPNSFTGGGGFDPSSLTIPNDWSGGMDQGIGVSPGGSVSGAPAANDPWSIWGKRANVGLSLLSGGLGIAGGIQQRQLAQQAADAQKQQAAQADPWGASGGRSQASSDLAALNADPTGQMAKDPRFAAMVQASQRANAMYGQGSGQMAVAGAAAGGNWYTQRLAELSGLAGTGNAGIASNAISNAGSTQLQGNLQGTQLAGQGLASIGYGANTASGGMSTAAMPPQVIQWLRQNGYNG